MDNDISEDRLQQEMAETRASLTEKLETLEQKVVGTVENATNTVSETVDAIKETVHETVASVQEGVKGGVDSVKEVFDLPAHVDKHPWLMVGGSVAVGYCVGTLLMQNSHREAAPAVSSGAMFGNAYAGNAYTPAPQPRTQNVPAPASVAEPSAWESEISKLKGLALGMLFGTAREMLVQSLPEHMGEQLKEIVDNVTRKVGGEPLPSSDWDKLREASSSESESSFSQETVPSQQQKAEAGMETGNPPQTGNGHRGARRW